MGAPDLLHALQSQGLRVWAKGDRLLVAPKERITDETRALIREHKAELLQALSTDPLPDPAAEARRQRVLAMLDENPAARYAVLTHDPGAPDAVILTVAIRGRAACELRIPREKYDPFLLLDLIERHSNATVH